MGEKEGSHHLHSESLWRFFAQFCKGGRARIRKPHPGHVQAQQAVIRSKLHRPGFQVANSRDLACRRADAHAPDLERSCLRNRVGDISRLP